MKKETKKIKKLYISVLNDLGFVSGFENLEIEGDKLETEIDNISLENGDFVEVRKIADLNEPTIIDLKYSDEELWFYKNGWWYGIDTNFSGDSEAFYNFIFENI